MVYRESIFSYIENLAEVYRKIILEKNESQKALETLEEPKTFHSQKLKEKYSFAFKNLK